MLCFDATLLRELFLQHLCHCVLLSSSSDRIIWSSYVAQLADSVMNVSILTVTLVLPHQIPSGLEQLHPEVSLLQVLS